MSGTKRVTKKSDGIHIDATGLNHREINDVILDVVKDGSVKKITLDNVVGQRYIATRLGGIPPIEIIINGTPGNDLGAFNDGHTLIVNGNAQDGMGNTMNDGTIIVHGHAGDLLGMSSRGGSMFVKGDVGYRVAIHMKEYHEKRPVLVIGGTPQDFFGEYMAGGTMILLGLTLEKGEKYHANYIGTGMHGGRIFIRGTVEEYQLGKEVSILEPDEDDMKEIRANVKAFAKYFGYDADEIMQEKFIKLLPLSKRPYGRIYAY